jgi:hypothetical protein
MNNEFLKYYLGEFYISKISRNIWNECKKHSIKDNLIIVCNIQDIRQIMSSLIVQSELRIYWKSVRLNDLLSIVFDNIQMDNNENKRLSFSEVFDPETLIIKEQSEPFHSYHKIMINQIIIERMFSKKVNSIIIIPTKRPNDLIDNDLLQNFDVLKFKEVIEPSKNIDNTNLISETIKDTQIIKDLTKSETYIKTNY